LPSGAPRWQAGDVCVLWPRNDGDGGITVRSLLRRLGLDGHHRVAIRMREEEDDEEKEESENKDKV